jgi:hypothetical protein
MRNPTRPEGHPTITSPPRGGVRNPTSPEGYQTTESPPWSTVRNPTCPEGYLTSEFAPVSEMSAPRQISDSGSRRRQTSTAFVVALSTILGIVIASGVILSVVGNAFYVSRDEYTSLKLKNAEEDSTLKSTLERMDRTLARQEQAFDKLADIVQNIKIDMASKRREK